MSGSEDVFLVLCCAFALHAPQNVRIIFFCSWVRMRKRESSLIPRLSERGKKEEGEEEEREGCVCVTRTIIHQVIAMRGGEGRRGKERDRGGGLRGEGGRGKSF